MAADLTRWLLGYDFSLYLGSLEMAKKKVAEAAEETGFDYKTASEVRQQANEAEAEAERKAKDALAAIPERNVSTFIPPEPAAEGEKVTKMEAVRRSIAAGFTMPADIVGFLQKHYGLEINEQTASSYKSNIKAKERDGSDGSTVSSASAGRKAAIKAGPSLADLFKVKDMVEKQDSLEAVAKMVNQVEELAEAVGGLDHLKACLDALVKLQG
jgi:hypothetical protein